MNETIYKSDQMAQRLAKENDRRKTLVELCQQLGDEGITSATLTYDGCGGEGSIDDIYYEPDSAKVNRRIEKQLKQAVGGLLPEGWETDDGGFGEFTLDIELKLIEHEHNDRVTAIETSEEVVALEHSDDETK